ncbi:MAG: ATP-dependent RecD-like DNA helicase [Oscillospiraceae bacterium]|jgi:exodeoxyribonuclease V alpha subunit
MAEQHMEIIELSGTVRALIFQNDENGYTVLRLDAKEAEHIVVGCMPAIAPGEQLLVRGHWVNHPTYGTQLQADYTQRSLPSEEAAILSYLSSGAIKGVGAATARQLVLAFGAETLSVIEEAPERLTQVKGITPKRAQDISRSFLSQSGIRLLLDFLTRHSLPLPLAMQLYRRYGDAALPALKENPYLLSDEEFHVDFSTVDTLAIELGLEADAPERVEAGLLFELSYNAGNGHTFLPRQKLLDATLSLIGVGRDIAEEGLDALIERGEVICAPVANTEACYLSWLYDAERYVTERVCLMAQAPMPPPPHLDALLQDAQKTQGIRYAPEQRAAVETAASCRMMLLTGGPGTGKTTTVRGILALFDALGLKTVLAAPTGRAANRLGEVCQREAATIHRLLEATFASDTRQTVFSKHENDPLAADAVIIDETSMVDLPLFQSLLRAMPFDCRLILVGDPDQLPSVGPGNVLSDLRRSQAVPEVLLTEIFRQSLQSAIVRGAHAVNRGELPDLTNQNQDFFFLRRRDPERVAETIAQLCQTRLPQNMGIPTSQIQVLSPTRRYVSGTEHLNLCLQEAVNPKAPEKRERKFGKYIFREGDRVMQIRNNYDLLWTSTDGGQAGAGVFNGDVGQIVSIVPGEDVVIVNYDGRLAEYTADLLGELEPAYAITVHKSQGSEYRAVILAVSQGSPMLLSRSVLYTAITRAKELFIVVGDDAVVSHMTENHRHRKRYSGLRWRIAQTGT